MLRLLTHKTITNARTANYQLRTGSRKRNLRSSKFEAIFSIIVRFFFLLLLVVRVRGLLAFLSTSTVTCQVSAVSCLQLRSLQLAESQTVADSRHPQPLSRAGSLVLRRWLVGGSGSCLDGAGAARAEAARCRDHLRTAGSLQRRLAVARGGGERRGAQFGACTRRGEGPLPLRVGTEAMAAAAAAGSVCCRLQGWWRRK